MEAPSLDAENVQAIRDDLGRLVTGGLLPFNVGDNCECLLELGLVIAQREDVDGDADETQRYEADARALRAVLEIAVAHRDISGKHRRLLRAVLPLKPELVGQSVKERRTVAGKDLKPDKDDVTAGTIRNHYEPKALDKLAGVLWQMELEFRVKSTPADDEQANSEDTGS